MNREQSAELLAHNSQMIFKYGEKMKQKRMPQQNVKSLF